MAKKEQENIKKGWRHIEGTGYSFKKPQGWTESKNLAKGVYLLLNSPQKHISIQLVSKYIESIPEGVHSLDDWTRLQYSMLGMPEALLETKMLPISHGEALEAKVKIGDEHIKTLYFANIFNEAEDKRMWFLVVASHDEISLESREVLEFLSSLEVTNYKW